MSNKKPVRPPPKPANLKFVRAEFAYQSKEADELSFSEGDLLYVLDDKTDVDWWRARCRGKEGLVPANYLRSAQENSLADLFPLHDACRRGNLDSLEECLLNRVPVNSADRAGNTPLHCAAHAGQLDAVTRLLSVPQAAVNAKNRLGDTPLHQAAWKGHTEIVRRLREAGADFNAANQEGQTASQVANDPETRAELERWAAAASEGKEDGVRPGEYGKEEYGNSDDDDDDGDAAVAE